VLFLLWIQIKNNKIKCPLDQKIHDFPKGKNSLCINYCMRELMMALSNIKGLSKDLSPSESIKKLIFDSFSSPDESLEIIKITEIQNNELKNKFKRKKKKIKGLNDELIKFHGTSLSCANSIAKNGFVLPQSFKRNSESGKEGNLNFGKAIYFSSYSSKAITYAVSSTPALVVSKIILGRVKEEKNSRENLTSNIAKSEGFDSIYCAHTLENSEINKGSLDDEYAIYDPEQILPYYIVEFSVKGLTDIKDFFHYKNNLSPKEINFNDLFKLMKKGSEIQKFNTLLTLGDVCRDYNNEVAKIIIQFFDDLR